MKLIGNKQRVTLRQLFTLVMDLFIISVQGHLKRQRSLIYYYINLIALIKMAV